MAIINKSTDKCWWGCGGRETLVGMLVGMQIGAAMLENSMVCLQKIKNGHAFWPSDSTSGYISKETQNTNSKEYKHLYVYCSVIYNSQDVEAVQVPISRWVDKTAIVHLHNGILLSHKKEIFYPLQQHGWTWRMYVKWNKPVWERLHLYVESN